MGTKPSIHFSPISNFISNSLFCFRFSFSSFPCFSLILRFSNIRIELGPVPERPISINPGLKFCSVSVILFLFIALGNILCYQHCIS